MDAKILNQILAIAFEKRVSDVHFEVDNPPFFRGRGQLIRSKLPNLTPADTEFIARSIMEHNNRVLPDVLKEQDASYSLPGGGRFRVSIFRQRGSIGIVMRVIPPQVGNLKYLQTLRVSGNRLAGEVPGSLLNLTTGAVNSQTDGDVGWRQHRLAIFRPFDDADAGCAEILAKAGIEEHRQGAHVDRGAVDSSVRFPGVGFYRRCPLFAGITDGCLEQRLHQLPG